MRGHFVLVAALLTACVSPSASLVTAGPVAKTCAWIGMNWQTSGGTTIPHLIVSHDGGCAHSISLPSSTPLNMDVVASPQHGTLETSGANTTVVTMVYTPTKGYEGRDQFVVSTGKAGQNYVQVEVTVVK